MDIINAYYSLFPIEHVQFTALLLSIASGLLIVSILSEKWETIPIKRDDEKNEEVDIYKGFRDLPGPTPFPIKFIGNVHQLPSRRDMHKKMDEMYEEYGDVYKITLFNEDIVCLNTAPLAQAILSSHDFNHFRKGETFEIYFNGVEGLPMLTGEKWKNRRKLVHGSFKYGAFRRYNKSFNKYADCLVKKLEDLFADGKVHQINDVVKECIFKQSSEAIMGVDISESDDGALFCKNLEEYLHIIGERFVKPWLLLDWVWKLHPYSRRVQKMFDEMAGVIEKVVQTHQGGNKEIKWSAESEQQNRNNLHELKTQTLETVEEENENHASMIEVMVKDGLADKAILEEVAVTLAAAHDTTSVAIQTALFLLALNPDHQEICCSEVDSVFNDPSKYSNGTLEFSALPDLKHLERCILESQRMISLASILMRKLEAPLKLTKLNAAGDNLVIPPGVSVYVFPSVIHKNPEYFPNPENFDPNRWTQEQTRNRHPYAYLSFSAGPRKCLGTKLAMVEAKLMIAKILRKFVVRTPDSFHECVVVPSVIPAPERPINFIFQKRNE